MSHEPSPPLCQQDIEGTIAAKFEKDREYCLVRVNEHLEMLLKKANRDIKLQRHVARHYYTRNWINKIRVRNLKKKLKKTLIKLRKRDNLDFFSDASLIV